MSAEAPKSDPRFVGARTVAWALYLAVAVGFSSLVIYSVFRSVFAMTPRPPKASVQLLPMDECLQKARQLLDELEGQRRGFVHDSGSRFADQAFLAFRTQWLERKEHLESDCVRAGESRQLKRVFDDMDSVLDLYTTASVQFSSTLGPALDSLQELINAREE